MAANDAARASIQRRRRRAAGAGLSLIRGILTLCGELEAVILRPRVPGGAARALPGDDRFQRGARRAAPTARLLVWSKRRSESSRGDRGSWPVAPIPHPLRRRGG